MDGSTPVLMAPPNRDLERIMKRIMWIRYLTSKAEKSQGHATQGASENPGGNGGARFTFGTFLNASRSKLVRDVPAARNAIQYE
eukprot:4797691-Amphidinium_carterae.1